MCLYWSYRPQNLEFTFSYSNWTFQFVKKSFTLGQAHLCLCLASAVRLAACFVAFSITLWLAADNFSSVTLSDSSKALECVCKSLRRSLAFCVSKTFDYVLIKLRLQSLFFNVTSYFLLNFNSNRHIWYTRHVLEKQFTHGQTGRNLGMFSTSINHHFLGF